MTRIDDRVRERAHRIWEEEGRPAGRADLHWAMARQSVALEESDRLAHAPCPKADGTETPRIQERLREKDQAPNAR
ncbi:DUF2934 domain-containing protein [Azorhizobium doebereinerae]|uniref:DUF2934 domain-containing protein n=1 Tax=Azorhizobium doebereinerae TaxID=281091 RepID=UPI00040CDEBF|nr:DUF2934 domain-containing protein [Azorhizobium doebereinerae]